MTESNGPTHVPPANEFGAETAESYKFWFNRVDLILGWLLRLPISIGSLIVGWNLVQGADWYYCLLAAMMLSTASGPALDLALSPLALLFWLCDGRYPLNQRFLRGICKLLCNAVWFSILCALYWFLTTRHVGTYTAKMEPLAGPYNVPAEKSDQTATEKAYREALANAAQAAIVTASPKPSPTPDPTAHFRASPEELVAPNYAQVRAEYQAAAEAGDVQCMTYMGWIYHHGWGVTQDYAQARDWYQKAAGIGNADAMNNLGVLYEHGLGVAQDYAQACEWYQKAVDGGLANAKADVSRMQERLKAANENVSMEHSTQRAPRRRSRLQETAR